MRALVVLKKGLPDGYLEEALLLAGILGAHEADFYHAKRVSLELLEAARPYELLALPDEPGSWELAEVFGGRVVVPRGSYPYLEVVAIGEVQGAEEIASKLNLPLIKVRRIMPWDIRVKGRLGLTQKLSIAKKLRFTVAVIP